MQFWLIEFDIRKYLKQFVWSVHRQLNNSCKLECDENLLSFARKL